MKRMLSLRPRCGLSGRRLSQVSTNVNRSSVEEEIVIPKRIQRGPTDILRALQSTIRKDDTAPEYKYIDDPFLIPVSTFEKRSYALSKESGKNAAKYMLRNFPECFKNNPAEPDIPHFNPPRAPFEEDQDNTEEDLLQCIDEANLTEAQIVYNNLESKGVQISDETLLKLLQIVSFYNETQSLASDVEERYFQQIKTSKSNTWKAAGLAEKLFEKIGNKNAEAYSALIQGMFKYRDVDRAFTLYKEMREKHLIPSVYVYNYLIHSIGRLKETHEARSDFLMQLLREMSVFNVQPNLHTFNEALEACARYDSLKAKKLCPQIMNEMKFLEIEPSLATYHWVLVGLYRSSARFPVMQSVMEQVVNRVWEVRDPRDFSFLPFAMESLAEHDADKKLAYQLVDLAELNPHLFHCAAVQAIFFKHFFRLLCIAEDFDKLMQAYNRFVPNSYSPEMSVLVDIFDALKLYRSYKYLPQLWSDAIVLQHADKEVVLKKVLSLTAEVKLESTEECEKMQKQCAVIARDVFDRIMEANEKRAATYRMPITLDAEMISDMLQTYLNADNFEHAKELLKYFMKNQNRIPGVPSATVLQLLAEKACRAEDKLTALTCAVYCADIGRASVADFVREQAIERNFGDEFLSRLDGKYIEPEIDEE